MDLLKKLREKEDFTEREMEIADYILDNCELILNMTTRELAARTFTSATVIVRFAKKLGYKGFNDFKLHLLMDIKENSYKNIEVEEKESVISIINKVSSLHEKVLLETKNLLSVEVMKKIQNAIIHTNQIDLFAFDANAAICEYISHSFMQAGKLSNVYNSVDKILLYEYMESSSIIIVVSKMGLNKHLLKAVKRLRKKGHFVIVITSNEESPLAKNCDALLKTQYKDSIIELEDISFHASISYIFNILISIIINSNYENAIALYDIHNQLFEY